MKKFNGILILIGALSALVLAFLLYSTGVFSPKEEENPTPTPANEYMSPRDNYEMDYDADPNQSKEIAVIHVMENFVDYVNPEQIYTYGYQEAVRKKINALIENGEYTEDKPLVIHNPFGTNSQSLYVYFETKEPCACAYNVHVSDTDSKAADFGGNVVASKKHMNYVDGCEEDVDTSYIHEFQVVGIQPDIDNTITFRLVDQSGIIRMRRFYYTFEEGIVNANELKLEKERATKTIVVDEKTLETATVNVTDEELENGLYCIFRAKNGYDPYMLVYDNDGFMRMEVPLEKAYAKSAYVKDGELYLFVSDKKFVKISSLGEVKKIYTSDEYTFGKDFCIDDKGNVLVLASRTGSGTTDDIVCIIDFEKEAVYELFDMGNFMSSLKKKQNCSNWLGLSSISYTGDNMVVLSADATNTLIKMRRIYNGPKLVYLAGETDYFEDLPDLQKMFLIHEGDFTFPTTVTEQGFEKYDKIRESRSYIWVLDRNLDYDYEKKEEHFGYYTRLLLDDEERTLRQIDESIVIKGITEESHLELYGDNKLLVKGDGSSFIEADHEFNTIYTFTYTAPVVHKTIEQKEYEEDNPPPDDTVRYVGISKINPVSYLFTDEIIVYIDGGALDDTTAATGESN